MKAWQKKRKKLIAALLMLVLLFVTAVSLAWYSFQKADVGKEAAEIMTPYFLYLMNAGDEKSLQFAVGNLHPGETKKVVICVTNKRPVDENEPNNVEIARESRFQYDMEFVHTNNLPVDYRIYELDKLAGDVTAGGLPADAVVLEGVTDAYFVPKGGVLTDYRDVSADRHQEAGVFGSDDVSDIWNAGTYLLYQKDSGGKALQLEYKYQQETQKYEYEYDYYLVELSWQSGIVFSDYAKETDLVYVIVNAKQVEPTVKE